MKPEPEQHRFEPELEIRDSNKPSAFEEHALVFVREPLLRPVLFVLVVHLMAALTPILLSAVRDTRIWAIVGLVPIIGATFEVVRTDFVRHGRPGVFGWLVLSVWTLSIASAFAADHWNLY